MGIGRAVRAWCLSVVACAALLGAWTVLQHAVAGRSQFAARNTADIVLAFGAVFAVVAATLHVPLFFILTAFAPERLNRGVAVLIGAALAPIVYLTLAMAFVESEGPQTVLEWPQLWLRHPWALVSGSAPFAVAGAVFGFAWVWPDSRLAPRQSRALR